MPGSPVRPSGRWVFDCVEIPTRAHGVKRRRDDSSPEPSPSNTSKSAPRKRERTMGRSGSPVTPSHPRSRAISPPVSEEMLEGSTRSGRGRPALTLDPQSEGDHAQASAPETPHSTSRSASSASLSERGLLVYKYEVGEDEIEESADLEVPGEDPVVGDDNDSETYSYEEDNVPVRLLDDFTIYDLNTLEVISASRLLEGLGDGGFSSHANYSASGEVRPWTEDPGETPDDDLEVEEDGLQQQYERVKLTRMTKFSVHHIEHRPIVEQPKLTTLDGKIYVCTEHAWYILGYPSSRYSPFFQPYWRMHRITHLLMNSLLSNPKLDERMFCKKLPEFDRQIDRPSNAFQVLGRDFNKTDYYADNVQLYLPSTVMDLSDELGIARTAFIREIKGKIAPDSHERGTEMEESPRWKGQKPKENKPLLKSDRDHRKNQTATYTTPIVSQISHNLFEVKMDSAKAPSSLETNRCKTTGVVTTAHKTAIRNYTFMAPILDVEEKKCYGEASIEGIMYKINDIVMVIPDPAYKGKNNYGWTSNTWGNTMWFCQLKYFFKTTKGEPMFHGQWYLHGSRTLLNELSHSQALYPVNICDDQPLDSIYQKAHVTFLSMDDPDPVDNAPPNTNEFHCRFFYHPDFAEFVNCPNGFAASLEGVGYCYSCVALQDEVMHQTPTLHAGTLSYGGKQYHVDDFIYIIPNAHGSDDKLLLIGQILEFQLSKEGSPMLSIRYHKRHIELENAEAVEPFPHPDNAELFFDERRLVLTSDEESVFYGICPSFLSGHCFVRYFKDKISTQLEQWVQHDDHFWVNSILDGSTGPPGRLRRLNPDEMDVCLECVGRQEDRIMEKQTFVGSMEKLVGMELFAGAGGLGLGMGLSGYVESRFAVEFMPSAAKTFKRNHPETIVVCQDTNKLLRYVVERDRGERPEKLCALDGGMCPEMPKKGDGIDFIFGGPPCQAFSRANHTRRADDIRSTMPCNMLSYIEHYQPKYFLLENVAGLLDYRLQDKRAVDEGNGAEIKLGMVKFIMRTLISLGYQVRYKLLQAAQYGVPQSRSRVIFLGAKQGLTLPDFPAPVYAFPKGCTKLSIPTDEHGSMMKMPAASRWKAKVVNEDDKDLRMFHQCAPHAMRTIFGATGDLLAFDWGHPYELSKKEVATLKALDGDRSWFGSQIRVVNACLTKGVGSRQPVGYPEGARYATKPQNRYQLWLRRNMRGATDGLDQKGKGKASSTKDGATEKKVTAHYTNRFNPRQVECTIAVPLRPDASHRDVPVDLWPEHAKLGRKQFTKTFYGRVGGDKYFKCAMTNMAPNIKQTWPLHPLQRRIYSVRECARAQGFPDDYEFDSIHDMHDNPQKAVADQIKQIGNAVAVPFALALGKELGEARITDWRATQSQREEGRSPEI